MTTGSWFAKITGQSMTLENLQDVLLEQLRDLYSAEEQLIAALPKMAEAACSSDLKRAFTHHLSETKQHKTRLEQAMRQLGQEPKAETCEAMKGLIKEGKQIIDSDGHPSVKDAALIAAAQRVEHYEIAGYGCARTFARQLGQNQVATILQQTLDEESNADEKLTQIAEGLVNIQAASAVAKS